jgi:hypothetical protein
VIEIAEELVEAVVAGQMLVEVAEVVLAELRRGVALRLQDLSERDILGLQAGGRARRADRGEPGPDRQLASDERGATRGAARLGIERGQPQPLLADPAMFGAATPIRSPPYDETFIQPTSSPMITRIFGSDACCPDAVESEGARSAWASRRVRSIARSL